MDLPFGRSFRFVKDRLDRTVWASVVMHVQVGTSGTVGMRNEGGDDTSGTLAVTDMNVYSGIQIADMIIWFSNTIRY